MRSTITAAVLAMSALVASNSAFAGADDGRVAGGYSSQVGAGHTVTYEVSLSKIKDSAGKPVRAASIQRMSLTTSMHAPATARSLTQTAYPCLDTEGKHMTRCSVEDGFSLTLTPRPAGAVSPRIVTEVNLHIIDLLNLKDGDTPVGPVQYPAIRLEKYAQEIVLTPGEVTQVATGSYVLDVRVKAVD
jgi:hypothetical protein